MPTPAFIAGFEKRALATKEAFVGSVLRSAGGALVNTGMKGMKAVGSYAVKHPIATAFGALTVADGVSQTAQAFNSVARKNVPTRNTGMTATY